MVVQYPGIFGWKYLYKLKSRVGFYILKALKYVRRNDLEGLNSNIVIVDLVGVVKSRLKKQCNMCVLTCDIEI